MPWPILSYQYIGSLQISWNFNYWPCELIQPCSSIPPGTGSLFEVLLRIQKWGTGGSKTGRGGEPTKGHSRASYHYEQMGFNPSEGSQRMVQTPTQNCPSQGWAGWLLILRLLLLMMVPGLLKPGHFSGWCAHRLRKVLQHWWLCREPQVRWGAALGRKLPMCLKLLIVRSEMGNP